MPTAAQLNELPVGLVLGAAEVTADDVAETLEPLEVPEADEEDFMDMDSASGLEPIKKAETIVLTELMYWPSLALR